MVRDGMIEVTQRGEIVDIDERSIESIKGPIRLRLGKQAKAVLTDEDVDDASDDEGDL